ncbi:MAG: monovalent cation/H(+) antiporter subunit G [Gemmatimonadetes bacterium]|nr:monovalent cation/H(+) antiporter subunit G [Gemmatimonadota bacterium]
MSAVLIIVSDICLVVGAIFCLIGALGMLRLPGFYTRLHAAGMIDTTGAGFLVLGFMIKAGLSLITIKLMFLLLFLLIASPTATHALAKTAYRNGHEPYRKDGPSSSS